MGKINFFFACQLYPLTVSIFEPTSNIVIQDTGAAQDAMPDPPPPPPLLSEFAVLAVKKIFRGVFHKDLSALRVMLKSQVAHGL